MKKRPSPRHLISDNTGSVGVVFGLALIPLVASIALAVDFGRVSTFRGNLQQMADSAALSAAAATVNGASDIEKLNKRIALANTELDGLIKSSGMTQTINRDIKGDAHRIQVKLSANLDMTLGKALYSSAGAEVNATAAIKRTETITKTGAPICLLSLNPSAADAVKFWGTSDLIAPTCAIQGNSTAAGAFNIGGSATATAAAFCTAGPSANGTAWSPAPKVNCPAKVDPFADLYTPSALLAQGVNINKACDAGGAVKPADGEVLDPSLFGGVYRLCAGLTVMANRTVTLRPGIYVINGALSVASGGVLNAPNDVVFYFAQGAASGGLRDGYLSVQGGASLTQKAPTSGPLAGMAMVAPTIFSASSTHTLIGGGTIDIVGMVYVPKSQFYVTGNGSARQVINANSAYFGIVADTFLMQGNGQIILNGGSDAASYAMPGMPTQTETVTQDTKAALVE